ncbi:MAG: hypothetical protein ABIC40_06710 [bacterium]
MPEPVEVTNMPPEYQELWDKSVKLIGELVDNEAFWAFLGDQDEELDKEKFKQNLIEFTQGYYPPNCFDSVVSVSRKIGISYPANCMTRGYNLTGLGGWMQIDTPSPIGTIDPVIYIMPSSGDLRWTFKLDPETRTCTISVFGRRPDETLTVEDAMPSVESALKELEFFLDQAAIWKAAGLITDDDEYELLITKGIEGLTNFEMVMEPPKEPSVCTVEKEEEEENSTEE